MIRRMRDLRRLVESVAAPYGAVAVVELTNGSHLRVTFTLGTRRGFIVTGFSPGDRRINRIVRADARRALKRLAAEDRVEAVL
jgi:hypothetical protein